MISPSSYSIDQSCGIQASNSVCEIVLYVRLIPRLTPAFIVNDLWYACEFISKSKGVFTHPCDDARIALMLVNENVQLAAKFLSSIPPRGNIARAL